ncbi:MAG: hypothetical protein ABI615_03645 [Chthoniobacterales bacterium]
MKIIRWLLALGVLYLAGKMMFIGFKTDGLGVIGLLYAVSGLIAAVIITSPETVRFLTTPITRFLGGLTFPESRNTKPILSYTLARHYEEQERYSESIEEYKKIIRYYPKEQKAYLEMLAIAMQSNDLSTYKKYSRAFKRRFKCELSLTYETFDPKNEFPGFKNGRPRRKRLL